MAVHHGRRGWGAGPRAGVPWVGGGRGGFLRGERLRQGGGGGTVPGADIHWARWRRRGSSARRGQKPGGVPLRRILRAGTGGGTPLISVKKAVETATFEEMMAAIMYFRFTDAFHPQHFLETVLLLRSTRRVLPLAFHHIPLLHPEVCGSAWQKGRFLGPFWGWIPSEERGPSQPPPPLRTPCPPSNTHLGGGGALEPACPPPHHHPQACV